MNPNPNLVDLCVYSMFTKSFFADDVTAWQEHQKVSNDLQKLFPTCQYQGRTIQLNWKINSNTSDLSCPPNRSRERELPYDLFVSIARPEVDLIGLNNHLSSVLAPGYLRSDAKVLLVVPYNKDVLKLENYPLFYKIVNLLDGTVLNLPNRKSIRLGYCQDKLAQGTLDKNNAHHLSDGLQVQQAIQDIVKNKFEQLSQLQDLEEGLAEKKQKLKELEQKIVQNKQDTEETDQVFANNVQESETVGQENEIQTKNEEQIESAASSSSSTTVQLTKEDVKKTSGMFNFFLSSIPTLNTVVTIVAVRILLPKVKEIGALGIGTVAGLISLFAVNHFRNKQA